MKTKPFWIRKNLKRFFDHLFPLARHFGINAGKYGFSKHKGNRAYELDVLIGPNGVGTPQWEQLKSLITAAMGITGWEQVSDWPGEANRVYSASYCGQRIWFICYYV